MLLIEGLGRARGQMDKIKKALGICQYHLVVSVECSFISFHLLSGICIDFVCRYKK